MYVTPRTEKEIAEMNLLPEGVYDFSVAKADEKISKSGNEMIELQLVIHRDDGSVTMMNDWLLDSMARKIHNACKVMGLWTDYNNGKLDAQDFVGKTGKVSIKIEKDKGGQYADRNAVKDYVVPKEGAEPPNHEPVRDDANPWEI